MGSCSSLPDNQKEQSKNKSHIIYIKAYTWNKDSYSLFDYETNKSMVKQCIKTTEPGYLIKQDNNIFIQKDLKSLAPEKNFLDVVNNEGVFFAQPSKFHQKLISNGVFDLDPMNCNVLWMVAKSYADNKNTKSGFKLSEGDLVRMGRVKLLIKEIKIDSENPSKGRTSPTKLNEETKYFDEKKSLNNSKIEGGGSCISLTNANSTVCRICLSETTQPNNPLISPCKCAGTMKFLHVQCLRKWLKSKLNIKKTGASISFNVKPSECELCKTKLPQTVEVLGKNFDLIEFPKPESPTYIMIEVLSKEKNQHKTIHILSMVDKKIIRLGRGHDSDIRLSDISVSRNHGFIKFEDGQFFVDDNNSKFGTLVLMRKPFEISSQNNISAVQIGRTLLEFHYKKQWNLFPVCCGSKPPNPKASPKIEKIQLPVHQSEIVLEENVEGEQNNEEVIINREEDEPSSPNSLSQIEIDPNEIENLEIVEIPIDNIALPEVAIENLVNGDYNSNSPSMNMSNRNRNYVRNSEQNEMVNAT